jgi:hypothetical protein
VAGLVWAYLKGSDLKTTALAGLAASSISTEGTETINEALNETALLNRMNVNMEEFL